MALFDTGVVPRAVLRVAAAHLAAGVLHDEGHLIVAPHGAVQRLAPLDPLASVVHPVAVHREVALEQHLVLPLARLRMQDPSEGALLGDAAFVANLPSNGRRGKRGHLGHQLTAPLALAQQEDARIQALDVVGAEDALRVAPDHQVDSRLVVHIKGEGEVHVGEDRVIVHPE